MKSRERNRIKRAKSIQAIRSSPTIPDSFPEPLRELILLANSCPGDECPARITYLHPHVVERVKEIGREIHLATKRLGIQSGLARAARDIKPYLRVSGDLSELAACWDGIGDFRW